MSGFPIIFGSGQDPDAAAYFASAGISQSAVTPTAYDNASSFNGTTQYLSIASNSTLQSGGGSFSFSGWVYFNSLASTVHFLAKSSVAGGTGTEYDIYYNAGAGIFFLVSNGSTFQYASTPNINANQWYYVTAWYDSVTGYANIQLNNGTIYTSSGTIGSVQQSTNDFNIGARIATSFFNGKMAGWGFWKKKLSTNDITVLYNNGIGLTYSGVVSAGITSNLVSYWPLNETTTAALCTRSDSSGSNTLTASATGMSASVVGPIATSTALSRQLINSFVIGVKSLGIWNSIVCWPLRSSQNSGGATARSLGGLGTFDSPLVNSPFWGSSGLNFIKTSTQFVGTSLNPNLTNNGIFVCSDWSAISSSETGISPIGNRDIFASAGKGTAMGITAANNIRIISNSDGATNSIYAITPLPVAYACHSMLSNGSVLTVNQNSTQLTTQTIVSGTAVGNLNIGCALYAQNTYKGVISFALASYCPVDNALLYNLYKSTIGLGLSLP